MIAPIYHLEGERTSLHAEETGENRQWWTEIIELFESDAGELHRRRAKMIKIFELCVTNLHVFGMRRGRIRQMEENYEFRMEVNRIYSKLQPICSGKIKRSDIANILYLTRFHYAPGQ